MCCLKQHMYHTYINAYMRIHTNNIDNNDNDDDDNDNDITFYYSVQAKCDWCGASMSLTSEEAGDAPPQAGNSNSDG